MRLILHALWLQARHLWEYLHVGHAMYADIIQQRDGTWIALVIQDRQRMSITHLRSQDEAVAYVRERWLMWSALISQQ